MAEDLQAHSAGPEVGDAFGKALVEYLEGDVEDGGFFVERDDGFLEWATPGYFIDQPSIWTEPEGRVPELVRGRILDVGAGGGRHSVVLQKSGHDITALDVSPGAIEVMRKRGVEQTFHGSIEDLARSSPEPFDTVLLCGNNLGLLESESRAPQFLGCLTEITVPGARIVGTGYDPFLTEDPLHLAYHELNRQRGRLPGQVRIRVRWTNLTTRWFDYLYLPLDQLALLTAGSGWKMVEHSSGGNPYLAVLERSG